MPTITYTDEELAAVERALARIDNAVPASAQHNFAAYDYFITQRDKYAPQTRSALDKTRAAMKESHANHP